MGNIVHRKPVFPTLESVEKAIAKILSKGFDEFKYSSDPKSYFKELDKFFLSTLGLLPYGFFKSNGDQLTVKCYRLRKWDEAFDPTFITEYSHPPASLVTTIQRANLPHHPVFYASPDAKTAI